MYALEIIHRLNGTSAEAAAAAAVGVTEFYPEPVAGPDFAVENHLSLFLLRPLTDEGARWLREHIAVEDAQFWGNALVVEPRYAPAVLEGIVSDGLRVE
jgi:hypothetical protein